MRHLSSLTRKYFMALSGLGLVLFVIVHLAGNLALYFPHGETFNAYAFQLTGLEILPLAEIGLLAIFVLHVAVALWTTAMSRVARPVGYKDYRSKHGPSKSTLGSRNMIVTGLVLLVFVVFHVNHFKFGPGIDRGYITYVKGEKARDLYRYVFEQFQRPGIVAFYVGCMLFLGFHLRHGFWSAFQSLGLNFPKSSNCLYALGLLLAIVLSAGFLFIPIYLYAVGGSLK